MSILLSAIRHLLSLRMQSPASTPRVRAEGACATWRMEVFTMTLSMGGVTHIGVGDTATLSMTYAPSNLYHGYKELSVGSFGVGKIEVLEGGQTIIGGTDTKERWSLPGPSSVTVRGSSPGQATLYLGYTPDGQQWPGGQYNQDSTTITVVDVASVTSDVDGICINCYVTFTAITDPTGYENLVTWSGGGSPSTGSGTTFRTRWMESGNKTVTASIGAANESKEVRIACPVNFHQTSWADVGDGVLYFEYTWESSTWNLWDLEGCQVGEVVYYPGPDDPYDPPNPPFLDWHIANPTRRAVDATIGEFADRHGHGDFTAPYCFASFMGLQWYQYLDGIGAPHNIESHDIYREVHLVNPSGPYEYEISKAGHSAKKQLP